MAWPAKTRSPRLLLFRREEVSDRHANRLGHLPEVHFHAASVKCFRQGLRLRRAMRLRFIDDDGPGGVLGMPEPAQCAAIKRLDAHACGRLCLDERGSDRPWL